MKKLRAFGALCLCMGTTLARLGAAQAAQTPEKAITASLIGTPDSIDFGRGVSVSAGGVDVSVGGTSVGGATLPPADGSATLDIGTWREAQDYFLRNGGPGNDPGGLDSDRDGIACETLLMRQ